MGGLSSEAYEDMRSSLMMLAELGAMPETAVAVVMRESPRGMRTGSGRSETRRSDL